MHTANNVIETWQPDVSSSDRPGCWVCWLSATPFVTLHKRTLSLFDAISVLASYTISILPELHRRVTCTINNLCLPAAFGSLICP